MKIPLLENSFGCCSLETGTKIIGYFQLAMSILGTIVIVCIVAPVAFVMVNDTDKKMYNDKTFSMDDDDDAGTMHEHKTETLSTAISGLGVALIFVVAMALIINYMSVIFLLLGVHKKRPSYMKLWLVFALFAIIGSIVRIASPKGITSFILNVYFTWVVYSHYRQLMDNLESPGELSHRQAKPQDVFVTVAPPSAPPPYTLFNEKPSCV